MAQWRRMSKNRRVLVLTTILAIAALTAGWAASRGPQAAIQVTPAPVDPVEKAATLSAPLPPPTQVFIQQTTAFPDFGNVLVTAVLGQEDLARKQDDGTRDFVTIGFQDKQVILRDDGDGGDAAAGDGVFTGIGTVDDADLQARADGDKTELANRGSKQAPMFMGRLSVGVENPQAFDLAAFQSGKAVPFGPAVAFVLPERQIAVPTTTNTTVKPASGGLTGIFAAGAAAVVPGTNVFQDRVLMIRDVNVVNDPTRTWNFCNGAGNPNGVWTFNHLMTQMANQAASGIDPSIFVENVFNQIKTATTINGHLVPAKPGVDPVVLLPWPKRPDGHIDLAQSPFRLLAIDPRLDLRRTTAGGGAYSINVSGNFLDAGEARFVFGLVTKNGNNCFTQPMAVIFEYRVPKCECKMVKGWAQQWIDLVNFVPGSAAYNTRLQLLTEQFVRANANPGRPNGSALGQFRTNEIALGGPWELREFQLTQFPFSFLNETTTADTAIDTFNNTAAFDGWILGAVAPALTAANMFQDSIPPVPLFFPTGTNFLGSNPRTPGTGFFWQFTTPAALSPAAGNNTTNWGRHRASLAACNGCHGRESRPTITLTPFVHVDPSTALGVQANLSEFLTGVNNLPDPEEPAPVPGEPLRNFDDLARRELDIQRVARLTCIGFHPINIGLIQSSLLTTGRLPSDLFQGVPIMPPMMRIPVAVDDFRRNLIFEVH